MPSQFDPSQLDPSLQQELQQSFPTLQSQLLTSFQQQALQQPQTGVQGPQLPQAAPPPPVTGESVAGTQGGPTGAFRQPDGSFLDVLGQPINEQFTGALNELSGQGSQQAQQQQGPAFPSGVNQQTFLSSVQNFQPNAEGFRSWWQQHGSELAAQGYSFIDHPTDPALVLPDGTHIDAIRGAGAAGSAWQWLVKDLGSSGTQTANVSTAPPSINTPLLNQLIQAQLQGTQQQQQQADFRNSVRDQLMQQLMAAQQIPNINDPILAAQQQAFDRSQQRALERFQHLNAEQFSTRGLLDSGARNVATEGFLQQQGEAGGAHAAGLVANDLLRRRQEVMQLMNLAVGIQDADLTRELQQQLVTLDAELQRELGLAGLNLQQLLGLGSLDLQRDLGLGQLDLGFSQLGENARQFDLGALISQALLGQGAN